ncbi:MAG: hypothetical protein HFG38_01435 [Eubacterium sp.]|jgi:hypothetical protein|nr:hypothetical protein [Eubacterium sp.]
MSVNGITGVTSAYATTNTAAATKNAETTAASKKNTAEDKGVVYEPSSTNAKDSNSTKVTDYSSIVAKMKQEQANHNKQLQDLVDKLLSKQADKYTSLADMFKNITVDPATAAQAQKDIGEDGYWGVNQTSDRLVEMAQALSGGDAEKADLMINAIKKGYDQAAKAWGGELPDICQQTVDAATEKLNKWRESLNEAQNVLE